MKCPVCQVELGHMRLVFEGLDQCPQCRGIWFDKGELDRQDGSTWLNIEHHPFHEVEGDHKQVDCPRCDAPLTPVSFQDQENLIVDRCPACEGFWLDSGEFQRVMDIVHGIHEELKEACEEEEEKKEQEDEKMLSPLERIRLAVEELINQQEE